jgi:hypothetical protein
MSSINFENIPLEIQQLAMELQAKIQQHCPEYQFIIDHNGPRFITAPPLYEETNNNDNGENSNSTPLTEFESRTINGLIDAMANSEQTETPPIYFSDEVSLLLYADLLLTKQYTETALYFEIGRILHDLTTGLTTAQITTEAKRLFKKNISSQNTTAKALAALRIYDYFKNFSGALNYKKIDEYFKPSPIGRLNKRNSDGLKERIVEMFTQMAMNSEEIDLDNILV